MSGREFFQDRYRQLGWELKEVTLRQAIRINNANAKGKNLVERLSKVGRSTAKNPVSRKRILGCRSQSFGRCNRRVPAWASTLFRKQPHRSRSSLFSDLGGKKVLDTSAAPGGKTTQLADLMENTGAIVALDVDKRRIVALSNHLERCHVANTAVYMLDARQAPI